jgi:hypothetical protein
MSSLMFGIICGAVITVAALILYRILAGEHITTTHKREMAEKPAPHDEE